MKKLLHFVDYAKRDSSDFWEHAYFLISIGFLVLVCLGLFGH